ncbi:MAG: hypothetical protein ACPGRZ_16065, partial [Alphaproteobacteria bacterium]
MKNSLKLTVSAIAAAAVLGAGSANATVFSFDEFVINKNGGEIFGDSFDDGVAPPSGPDDGILGPGGTYLVSGSGIVSENAGGNGRLLIDTAQGLQVTNPNGDGRLLNRIRRLRSTNPASSAVLDQASSWSVNVILDLATLPINNGDAAGFRVEDFSGSNPNGGNDRLLLEVRRSNLSGNLGVLFSGLEFNGVGIETFDFVTLDPLLTASPTADQIELTLSNGAGSALVAADFSLLSSGSSIYSQSLDALGNTSGIMAQVFSDEGFTRAALHTIENAEIPEPGAIALMGVGI